MLRAISLSAIAFTFVVALPFPSPGTAAEASVSQVVEQARFWEKRGRQDLANTAWEKVLIADPDNTDALAALGTAAAYAGDESLAQSYRDRLRAVNPDHPGLGAIKTAGTKPAPQARDPEPNDTQALTRARELGQNDQKAQAISKYREHFGNRQPSGELGLEFYQTLGGTSDGWEEARAGLKRLSEENPDDPRYRLAYAEHLTYREATRRDGIGILADLEGRQSVASRAQASRRQALIWLDARSGDYGLYQRYLEDHPQDGAIKSRYAQVKRDFPRGGPRTTSPAPYTLSRSDKQAREGFDALNNNRLGEAENIFSDLRSREPNNANALGGLGIIALKRQQFGQAEALLQQASRQQPSTASRWQDSLSSARVWSRVQAAEQARQNGDRAEAISLFENALQARPGETAVRVSYADTLAEAGRNQDALAQYNRVLSSDAGNAGAARGKIYALSRLGRSDEALRFAESIPAEQRQQIAGLDSLQATALREAGAQAMRDGDARRAEQLLNQSIEADPDSPYSRLLLADLYRQTGQTGRANAMLEQLTAGSDATPEALFIRALILAEEERWLEGLRTLERVPANARTADMQALQRRMWMRYESNRASVMARNGDLQGAEAALERINSLPDKDIETLGALAEGYAQIGQSDRALAMLRKAMNSTARPSPALRLQYASLLSQQGMEAEFRGQLRALRGQYDSLSVSERQGLAQLEAGFAVQKADALREQGLLADAYEHLRPHLAADPEDAALNMALARLYMDFDEPLDALDLYYDVLERNPDDVKAYEGAISAATASGKYDEAEWLVKRALERDPKNPRLYVLAGRMERAQGNDQEAVSLFKQALALDSIRVSDGLGPVGTPAEYRREGNQNPFGQPTQSRAQAEPAQAYAFRRETARSGPEARAYAEQARQYQQAAEQRYPAAHGGGYQGRQVPGTAYQNNSDMMSRQTVNEAMYQPQRRMRLAQRYNDGPYSPTADAPPGRTSNPRGELIDEIATIQSQRSSWLAAGLNLRYRDGQDGLGELTDVETPLEFSLGEAGPGRLRFRVIPVALDSGRVSGFNSLAFGALPLAEAENGTGSAASIAASNSAYDQSDNGVALGVVYELNNLRLDIGSTPLGFEEENLVGGIRWTPTFDDVLLSVDIARRSVTDSLLSYAGTHDPYLDGLAGQEASFGGVTRNGARVDIARDFGVNGVYANFGGYFLEGEKVEDNLNFELGGGYYHRLMQRRNSELTVGVNLTTLFYEENLGEFTVGHGGYFSPQFYTAVSIPIEWTGRHERLAYRIGGSLGIQAFDEDDADIFPGNFGGLQDRLEVAGGIDGRTTYEGTDETGANIGFHAAAEYMLTPHFSVGGKSTFSNARDYDEMGVGAYIRYWFRPQAPASMPAPRFLAPFYTGDPSW